MTHSPEDAVPSVWPAALFRGLLFLGLWVTCAGAGAVELMVGLVASVLAVPVSLRLLPPARARLDGLALAAFLPPFIGRTVLAGWDVARRVFAPVPAVAPGFLIVPTRVPQGLARDAYRAVASLMPGTLPVGPDAHETLTLHCLDRFTASADAAAREEAAFLALARKE